MLHADEVVIDLEDSVPISMKPGCLAAVLDSLSSWPASAPTVSVRINPPGTPWCETELQELAAAPGPLASVVIPKVDSAEDPEYVQQLLDDTEPTGRRQPLQIQALIETACGLARVHEIADSSLRLSSLILGYADLAASLGRSGRGAENLDLWLDVQNAILVAARAQNLDAIDGPYLGTADDARFRAAAQRARDLGFDGKWALHPSQTQALEDIFTPSAQEIRQAHDILDALSRGELEDATGVVNVDGVMVDEAVRKSALRVLARERAAVARR